MTITMIGFILYAILLAILFMRFWRVMTAGTDMWLDPAISPVDKLVLNGYGFRSKLLKFLCDVFFSITFAGIFVALVPGLAGGPLGALAGLGVSSMLTGSSRYVRWRKRRFYR